MKKSFQETVIEALKSAKERYGSIKSLAIAADVNDVTLGRWLSCQRNPTVIEVGKIFDLMDVSLCYPGEQSPAGEDCAPLRAELERLRRELDAVRTERDRALGQRDLLKEQNAELREQLAEKESLSPAVGLSARFGRLSDAVTGDEK